MFYKSDSYLQLSPPLLYHPHHHLLLPLLLLRLPVYFAQQLLCFATFVWSLPMCPVRRSKRFSGIFLFPKSQITMREEEGGEGGTFLLPATPRRRRREEEKVEETDP